VTSIVPQAAPAPAGVDWVPIWGYSQSGVVPTTQPSVRVYRNATQSIPNTAMTAVQWTTVRYDNGPSPHWVSGSPTRLTCQVAGTYLVWGEVQWAGVAGGTIRGAWPYLNGSIYIGAGGPQGSTQIASGNPIANSPSLVYLNVGDYVELLCYQDSGSAVNVNASDGGTSRHSCEFGMALLGGMQGPPGLQTPVSYGTQLPASPVDGQEAILVDSVTNPSYQWRFRYNAASTGTYKWEFVGGTTAHVEASAAVVVPNSGWNVVAAPTFTLPRAGTYLFTGWVDWTNVTAAVGMWLAPAIGAGTVGGGAMTYLPAGQNMGGIPSTGQTTQPAGAVANLMVWAGVANTITLQRRMLQIQPWRVS